jgi:hypothetical protein
MKPEPIPYFYDSVNRSAVGVKPKQPFLNWINAIYPDSPVIDIEGNIYLLKAKNDTAEIEKWLLVNFDKIFQNELNDWHTDAADWPAPRSHKLLLEWFDIAIYPMVLDLEKSAVIKD